MSEVVPPMVALVTAGSVLLLAAFGVVVAVGYLLGCRIWPYTNCPRCHGDGRRLLDHHTNH